MCSRPYRPFGLPIYVARAPAAPFSPLPIAALPSMSRVPRARLKLARCARSLAASLAVFPSKSLFPKLQSTSRFSHLCRSRPRGSIVSRSLPLGSTGYPRGFTGHVAHPSRSIETRSLLSSQLYLAPLGFFRSRASHSDAATARTQAPRLPLQICGRRDDRHYIDQKFMHRKRIMMRRESSFRMVEDVKTSSTSRGYVKLRESHAPLRNRET